MLCHAYVLSLPTILWWRPALALQNLRNPGMRTRHWDQLTTDLGRDMHFDSSYTLDAALKSGLQGHLDQISKVSDVASKEYSIEQVRFIHGAPDGRHTCGNLFCIQKIQPVPNAESTDSVVSLKMWSDVVHPEAACCCCACCGRLWTSFRLSGRQQC